MVLLLGCSGIESRPATFVQLAIGTKPSSFVVANDVSVSIPGGRSTELREGSVWESVGKLPEGVVYRSRGTDLVLEDSDFSTQHEAYIVVDQRSLIGFYLPAEDRYVGVKHVHPLPIQ